MANYRPVSPIAATIEKHITEMLESPLWPTNENKQGVIEATARLAAHDIAREIASALRSMGEYACGGFEDGAAEFVLEHFDPYYTEG